jgi:hypothetical protein
LVIEPLEGNMAGTPSPSTVSTRQQRIAELARQAPQLAFTSLNHLIDPQWLYEAYRRTRKDGAAGVDGQTASDYEIDLWGNLRSLLDRAKSGTYWAPPVRRVHIPKGTGIPEPRDLTPAHLPMGRLLLDGVLQRHDPRLVRPAADQSQLSLFCRGRQQRHPTTEQDRDHRDLDGVHQPRSEQAAKE